MSWTYTSFSDGTKASAESAMGNFYNARHGDLLPRDPSTGAASTATATSLSGWNRIYANILIVPTTATSAKTEILFKTVTAQMTHNGKPYSFMVNHESLGATHLYAAIFHSMTSEANTTTAWTVTNTIEFDLASIHPSITASNILDVSVFHSLGRASQAYTEYTGKFSLTWDSSKITIVSDRTGAWWASGRSNGLFGVRVLYI